MTNRYNEWVQCPDTGQPTTTILIGSNIPLGL